MNRTKRHSIHRKGTEKPIEIFVALFIILAVALVMLKLFQGQISDKQKELADVQQEQKAQDMKNKVQLSCQQKCTDASNSGCNIAALASLCAYNSENILGKGEFVDLNNDKMKNVDTTLLAGIEVCEDKVYCFHVVSSCCARSISAESCKVYLSEYWESKSLDVDEMLEKNMKYSKGACTASGEDWHSILFSE